jgi:hypothetical protein
MQHFHDVVGQVAGGDIINCGFSRPVTGMAKFRHLAPNAVLFAACSIASLCALALIAPAVIERDLTLWAIPAALLPQLFGYSVFMRRVKTLPREPA